MSDIGKTISELVVEQKQWEQKESGHLIGILRYIMTQRVGLLLASLVLLWKIITDMRGVLISFSKQFIGVIFDPSGDKTKFLILPEHYILWIIFFVILGLLTLIWLADSLLAKKQKRIETRLEEMEESSVPNASKRSLTKIFSGMKMPDVPVLINRRLRFFYLARWIVLGLYMVSCIIFIYLIIQHKNTKVFGRAVTPGKQTSIQLQVVKEKT